MAPPLPMVIANKQSFWPTDEEFQFYGHNPNQIGPYQPHSRGTQSQKKKANSQLSKNVMVHFGIWSISWKHPVMRS